MVHSIVIDVVSHRVVDGVILSSVVLIERSVVLGSEVLVTQVRIR